MSRGRRLGWCVTEDLTTELITLKRTPYSETSWVVVGLSPEHGLLGFMCRGARRVSKRRYSMVDVLQHVSVIYRQGRGGLLNWRSAELLVDYGGVARDYGLYQSAGWLMRFILLNVFAGVPQPGVFQAVGVALARLCAGCNASPRAVGLGDAAIATTCLVYLNENGLLQEFEGDPQTERQCEQLLLAGLGENEYPVLSQESWQKVREWTVMLLHRTDCSVPGTR